MGQRRWFFMPIHVVHVSTKTHFRHVCLVFKYVWAMLWKDQYAIMSSSVHNVLLHTITLVSRQSIWYLIQHICIYLTDPGFEKLWLLNATIASTSMYDSVAWKYNTSCNFIVKLLHLYYRGASVFGIDLCFISVLICLAFLLLSCHDVYHVMMSTMSWCLPCHDVYHVMMSTMSWCLPCHDVYHVMMSTMSWCLPCQIDQAFT